MPNESVLQRQKRIIADIANHRIIPDERIGGAMSPGAPPDGVSQSDFAMARQRAFQEQNPQIAARATLPQPDEGYGPYTAALGRTVGLDLPERQYGMSPGNRIATEFLGAAYDPTIGLIANAGRMAGGLPYDPVGAEARASLEPPQSRGEAIGRGIAGAAGTALPFLMPAGPLGLANLPMAAAETAAKFGGAALKAAPTLGKLGGGILGYTAAAEAPRLASDVINAPSGEAATAAVQGVGKIAAAPVTMPWQIATQAAPAAYQAAKNTVTGRGTPEELLDQYKQSEGLAAILLARFAKGKATPETPTGTDIELRGNRPPPIDESTRFSEGLAKAKDVSPPPGGRRPIDATMTEEQFRALQDAMKAEGWTGEFKATRTPDGKLHVRGWGQPPPGTATVTDVKQPNAPASGEPFRPWRSPQPEQPPMQPYPESDMLKQKVATPPIQQEANPYMPGSRVAESNLPWQGRAGAKGERADGRGNPIEQGNIRGERPGQIETPEPGPIPPTQGASLEEVKTEAAQAEGQVSGTGESTGPSGATAAPDSSELRGQLKQRGFNTAFIDGRVAALGSVEAVDAKYETDSLVDQYARAVAREKFNKKAKQTYEMTRAEHEKQASDIIAAKKRQKLRETYAEFGSTPINRQSDGTFTAGNHDVPLDATLEEKRAANKAMNEIELAETPKERLDAKKALQDALRPAIERALSVDDSGLLKLRHDIDHRYEVESAVAAGKPVPPEVLADYPDLQNAKTSAQDVAERLASAKSARTKSYYIDSDGVKTLRPPPYGAYTEFKPDGTEVKFDKKGVPNTVPATKVEAKQPAKTGDAIPSKVQRIEEPNTQPGTVDKPHGLYTSLVGSKAHEHLGGDTTQLETNPDANILEPNPTGRIKTNRGTVDLSAGIAALRHYVGDAEASRVASMNKFNAAKHAATLFPSVDWSRYHDAHEIAEGLGAMMAREKGYDAIWNPDKDPQYSEYVGLTEKAFKKGAPSVAPATKDVAAQYPDLQKGQPNEVPEKAVEKGRVEGTQANAQEGGGGERGLHDEGVPPGRQTGGQVESKEVGDRAWSNQDLLRERKAILDEAADVAMSSGYDDFATRGEKAQYRDRVADIDHDLIARGVDKRELVPLDSHIQAKVMQRDLRADATSKRGTTVDMTDNGETGPRPPTQPKPSTLPPFAKTKVEQKEPARPPAGGRAGDVENPLKLNAAERAAIREQAAKPVSEQERSPQLRVVNSEAVAPKAVRVDPAVLDNKVKSDSGYVYHATNSERLGEIADSGKLRTHKPNEFTDQDVWPDGSVEKRNYFSRKADVVWQFAPEDGTPVLVRTKEAGLTTESTGDVYGTKPIPSKNLEYLGKDGAWHPVDSMKSKPHSAADQVDAETKGDDSVTLYANPVIPLAKAAVSAVKGAPAAAKAAAIGMKDAANFGGGEMVNRLRVNAIGKKIAASFDQMSAKEDLLAAKYENKVIDAYHGLKQSDITWMYADSGKGGFSNLQLMQDNVPYPATSPPNARVKAALDAYRKMVDATGDEAEAKKMLNPDGTAWRKAVSGRVLREYTMDTQDAIHYKRGKIWDAFVKAVSAANPGMSISTVKTILGEELGLSSVRRVGAIEGRRKIPYIPAYGVVDGKPYSFFVADYLRSTLGAGRRMARRIYFADQFGQGVNDNRLETIRNQFVQDGGRARDLDDVISVWNRRPYGLMSDMLGMDPRNIIRRTYRVADSIISTMQTSLSSIPNLPQTMVAVSANAGLANYLKAVATVLHSPKMTATQLSAIGGFHRAIIDWTINDGSIPEDLTRLVSQTLSTATGMRHIAYFNNLVAGEAGRLLAEQWKLHKLKDGDMSIAKTLRLTEKEIAEAQAGRISDLVRAKIIRGMVAVTQGVTEDPHRMSKFQNIPILRSLLAYNNYAILQGKQAYRLGRETVEAMKSGDASRMGTAGKRIAYWLAGMIGAGLLVRQLKRWVYDRDDKKDSAAEEIGSALWESAILGPVQRLSDSWEYGGGSATRMFMDASPKIRFLAELGDSLLKKKGDTLENVMRVIERNTPIAKAVRANAPDVLPWAKSLAKPHKTDWVPKTKAGR